MWIRNGDGEGVQGQVDTGLYVQLTLGQRGLNCGGPLIHGMFPINTVNVCSLPFDLCNILFSLAYFLARIQYIIHISYRLGVHWLFFCDG